MRNLWTILILVVFASGCTVGPDYKRPSVDIPTDWRVNEQEARELADSEWWRQFNDPVMNDLIATALRENKDLLIAAARIEEFAGRYGIVRADLFPQVGGAAEYTRQRVTETGDNRLASGYKVTTDTYSATLNAGWEIDLWGRIRRSTEGGPGATDRQRGGAAGGDPEPGQQCGQRLHQSPRSRPATGDQPQYRR